ncbi:hypothetical protein [Stenotrophomonas hibiscicola]|uniref:hypothetical protein n=1 Tax=Stenotrophomonas hibiscicola TaxID=86189 RepID=UPI00036EA89D|nr:hypothetical protein [[Pseudomonas] hibiscicola]
MNEIEKRARELLAAEMERSGRKGTANKIRQGRPAMFREELRAIITALTPPEGYVLVPVEPTEAMLRAGGWVEPPDSHGQEYIEKQGAAQCWKLMMNARPEVPDGRG